MNTSNAILKQVVNPHEVFSAQATGGTLGWILCETVGQALRFWRQELEDNADLQLIGEVRGIKSPGHGEFLALDSLIAHMGGTMGERVPAFASSENLEGGRTGPRYFEILRELIHRNVDHSRAVVLVRDAESLDEGSCEVLTRLALNDDIRLFIHAGVVSTLPRKWRSWHETGNLSSCPEGRVSVAQAVSVFSEALGYQVPRLGALALHHATDGRAGQLDLVLENVDPSILRAVLFTGATGLLPMIDQASMLLQARRGALGAEGQHLLGLCAILGHLPLDAAYELLGRKSVDLALTSGLASRRICGDTQIITMASPMLQRHWKAALSGFERVELEALATGVQHCCKIRLPEVVASLLAQGELPEVKMVIEALNIASESSNPSAGEAAAQHIRGALPWISEASVGVSASVALARFNYVLHGSHAALRELNRGAMFRPELWQDSETAQLLVQICLETGRLLPTIQRIAAERGHPVPVLRDDPVMLDLLPDDALNRRLHAGLDAARKGDVRRAAVYFISGLRQALSAEHSPNAVALRGTLLSAAGICLAMGGYAKGMQDLNSYLHRMPSPWHARSMAALELSLGLGELQQGQLATGSLSLAVAAQSAMMIDAESVHSSIQDIDQVLTRFKDFSTVDATGANPGMARSFVIEGRRRIEDFATAGLLRDPAAQQVLLAHANCFADPRAHALAIGARSQLGLDSPILAIKSLLELGQGFIAAWVADGVIMSHVFSNVGAEVLAMTHAKYPTEPMEIVRSLLAPLGSAPVPGVPRELITRLDSFEMQALSSLPFLAHEVRARTLTPREAEIAHLAKTGMNNREIARGLTISVRTVEGHIASILEKLSLDSREDLSPSLELAIVS